MDGLLIGRFQPFHLGHLSAIQFALSITDHLWVGIGSSNKTSDTQNPFTVSQRQDMILSSVDESTKKRIAIYPIPDTNNHIHWIQGISSIVPRFEIVFSNDKMTRDLYSSRNVRAVPIPFMKRNELSGTRIRHMLASNTPGWESLIPVGTQNVLTSVGYPPSQ